MGAILGAVWGLLRHPLLGVVGLILGPIDGGLYAGVGCFVCGATLDFCETAFRDRRFVWGSLLLLVWLATSVAVFAGVLGLFYLLCRFF